LGFSGDGSDSPLWRIAEGLKLVDSGPSASRQIVRKADSEKQQRSEHLGSPHRLFAVKLARSDPEKPLCRAERLGSMRGASCCDVEANLQKEFRSFIKASDFPCVGAKAALARGALKITIADDIRSAWNDLPIHEELLEWTREYRRAPTGLRSLAVVFKNPVDLSEAEFERFVWERLQSLADKDAWRGQPYDPVVSSDPTDPHFSLSFGGDAFFVVGLHPKASRPARRFAHPSVVFNLHEQFERLRAEGRYERFREQIIARDIALAGTPNPMLKRYGEASAAAQYSGRAVPDGWECPFRDVRGSP
jgi:uncharacterized protein